MKKFLASLLVLGAFISQGSAQTTSGPNRPKALGISFALNDYTTAQRIRSGSLAGVLRDKKAAKIKDMSPGLAISYFKGLRSHVDFAATLAGSFVNIPIQDRTKTNDDFLLEADASLNLKMLPENFFFTPYLNVGVGASAYDGKFGAFLPLGAGLKFNLFNEAAIFINSQYRIPVTTTTANYHFFHSIGIASTIGK